MKVVFIIEPDKVLASTYAEYVGDYQTYIFTTARTAIRALEHVIPDIVILEIALPSHNGFEFLYELFSYSDTRHIRVVVNSFIQESDLPWGILNRGDFNIVDYLHKPFVTQKTLKRVMEDVMRAGMIAS